MGARGLFGVGVVVVAVVLVGVAVVCGAAFAAAPATPRALNAESVGSTSATLRGELNGNEEGTYEFFFQASASECQNGRSLSEARSVGGSFPPGRSNYAVTGFVSGLLPNTEYSFCVLVRTPLGGSSLLSNPVQFTTLGELPPSIGVESVGHTGSRGTLAGTQIETGGLETTYRVQYGKSVAYGSETVATRITSATAVSVALNDLEPDTTYHLRFVASNALGTVDGSDVVVTTYSPADTELPDGRVYELVSRFGNPDTEAYVPQSLDGTPAFNFAFPRFSTYPFEASASGAAVTFVGSTSTVGGSGSEIDERGNQYFASRSSQSGWVLNNITGPGQSHSAYRSFSSDLTVGFVTLNVVPPIIASEAPFASPEGFNGTLYPQYNALYEHFTAGSVFAPLTVASPRRLPSSHIEDFFNQVFKAVSADNSHVVFESTEDSVEGEGTAEKELAETISKEVTEESESIKLREESHVLLEEAKTIELKYGEETQEAREKRAELRAKYKQAIALQNVSENEELYVEADGRYSLVNVLPEGRLDVGASFGNDLSGVVSVDGSRVFWESGGEVVNPGTIFVRLDSASTVQVSAGSAQFETATPDGKYAFYLEGGKLWQSDVEDGSRMELAGVAGGVQGVVGTNETGQDGEYVYFVSQEKLTSETNAAKREAVAGEDNLYVYEPDPAHPGQSRIVFVATLGEREASDWSAQLASRTSNHTPDGHGLVFESMRNLTSGSYPGEGSTQEVYVFDANDESLVCASCRPQASGGWLAGSGDRTDVHRWISEDGNRVFFESAAPLVAQDVDGVTDVYEWERDGTGQCTEPEGCVYLLSNGTEGQAFFIDASANGNDVFIDTSQRLAPEEEEGAPESFVVFDARVGGQHSVAPPQCAGTGCQGVPAGAPIFATPSSVTFAGVGNFPPPGKEQVALSKAKSKRLTRAQKLERELGLCHRQRSRSRRSVCEARARRTYAARKANIAVGRRAKRIGTVASGEGR